MRAQESSQRHPLTPALSPSGGEGEKPFFGRFSPRACSALMYLGILLFAGCAVGPDYKRPPVAQPEGFRGESSTATNSFGELPWWEVFHDEKLQELIRTALTNNYDVRIAAARVEQARALADQARSQLLPQVDYFAGAGKGKNIGTATTLAPTGTTAGALQFGGTASWEIDLFGRIRRLTESAKAQFFASQEAKRDVTISLIAQVAQDYFQLLALDRELAIARDATNSFGDSLRIFNQRLTGGVASKLETSSAEALLASSAATIPDLERQIVQLENQLGVLLGRPPGPIGRTGSILEGQGLPEVPSGLPSSLLERRPDIRQAEQLLRSANAQVGVAKADFFPQLTLTGLIGQVSPELATLTGGAAFAWGAAASLTGPVFHGGELRAQYRGAKATRDQFVLQYQATVLYALQEVADALVARTKLADVRTQQEHAVMSYQEAFKIAKDRYQQGQSSYYEVLQEQQLLFPAETTLTQTQFSQLTAVVQLYRALGGGWTETNKVSKGSP
jgi:multidrug efflux system outer membrane protein